MRRSILIVLVIGLITATAGFVSNSSTNSELNSKQAETDKIVLAVVESLKDDAKKNSSVTNLSAKYEGNKSAILNYAFSNATTNETGTVSYKIQRFNSITDADKFTNDSSTDYTKLQIASNDTLLRNYVKAAKHEPKVSTLLVKFEYAPLEENLIVQFDDVVIMGNIKISNADFGG
jgi:hypothetical protein